MSSQSEARWIPLESNPEVFNSWAEKAGLVLSQAQFQDVYGLDQELLSLVSQPVNAIILLFPTNPEADARAKEEDDKIAKEGQPMIDGTIFWVKQTISNACGTIALIHALANSDVTFTPGSPLQKFIIECYDKSPAERARTLETTPLFTHIHAETAHGGQTAIPADLGTDLHFTCFIAAPEAEFREVAEGRTHVDEETLSPRAQEETPMPGALEGTPNPGATEGMPQPDALADDSTPQPSEDAPTTTQEEPTGMRLIELDGRRRGPIDRGECKDLLRDVAQLVKDRYLSMTASVYFSLMALGPPQ